MKARSPLSVGFGFVWLLLVALNVQGAEWKSETFNCAIQFPDGWTPVKMQQPTIRAAFRNPDRTRILGVMVLEAVDRGMSGVNEEYIRGVKHGFTVKGGVILSEQRVTVDGLPAYRFVGRIAGKARSVSLEVTTFIAEGRAYSVQAMDLAGDVTKDPDLLHSLDSFRFLEPPKVLPASATLFRNSAYRMGYLFGRYVVFGLIAVGIIIVIGIVARNVFRKPKPPPLPPAAG